MLTNWNNRVLYTGVTNDLESRIYEHKNKLVKGFTAKYNVNKLVYFECTSEMTRVTRGRFVCHQTYNKYLGMVVPNYYDMYAKPITTV
jgi:predicted GIY-YIG superfamily endonuclease